MFTTPTTTFANWASARKSLGRQLDNAGVEYFQGPNYFHLTENGNSDRVLVYNRQTNQFREFNRNTEGEALKAALLQ